METASKYENLKGIDSLSRASGMLDELKEDMTDNTLKLMNNTVNLETLGRKADSLNGNPQITQKTHRCSR
jgi:hypothetical protein